MAEVVLIIEGPIARSDIPVWCARVQRMVALTGGAAPVICDVTGLRAADAASIDGLARMHLTARRMGSEIHLRGASERLCALLALFGLAEVIPLCRRLAVESVRQAEEREELGGVEEEVQPDDPSL